MWSCLSKYMKSILKMKAVTYIHPPVILNGLERCWPHGSEGLTQWAVVELKSQSVKSTLGLPAPLRCCRVCTFIYPDPRTRLSWYRLCWYMVTGSKKKRLAFQVFPSTASNMLVPEPLRQVVLMYPDTLSLHGTRQNIQYAHKCHCFQEVPAAPNFSGTSGCSTGYRKTRTPGYQMGVLALILPLPLTNSRMIAGRQCNF